MKSCSEMKVNMIILLWTALTMGNFFMFSLVILVIQIIVI